MWRGSTNVVRAIFARRYSSGKSIQYVSDLHLERKGNTFPRLKIVSTNLALCGDIGDPSKQNYQSFLGYCSLNYKNVFLVAGNHEYHGSKTIQDTNAMIADVTSKYPNVWFLNDNSQTLYDYQVYGTVLWTDAKASSRRSPKQPSSSAGKFITNFFQVQHQLHMKKLRKFLSEKKQDKIILLSHHLPSYQLIIPKYHAARYKKYQKYFASHLDSFILSNNQIKYWICGHSHSVNEIQIGNTLCAINAASVIPKKIDLC